MTPTEEPEGGPSAGRPIEHQVDPEVIAGRQQTRDRSMQRLGIAQNAEPKASKSFRANDAGDTVSAIASTLACEESGLLRCSMPKVSWLTHLVW